MAGPYYRITIHNTSEVTARTDGFVKVEVFVEYDELGDNNWAILPDAPNHFDVLIPATEITAINTNPLYDTAPKRRKAMEALVVASDVRLLALRDADTAARFAINWLNLKVAADSWVI